MTCKVSLPFLFGLFGISCNDGIPSNPDLEFYGVVRSIETTEPMPNIPLTLIIFDSELGYPLDLESGSTTGLGMQFQGLSDQMGNYSFTVTSSIEIMDWNYIIKVDVDSLINFNIGLYECGLSLGAWNEKLSNRNLLQKDITIDHSTYLQLNVNRLDLASPTTLNYIGFCFDNFRPAEARADTTLYRTLSYTRYHTVPLVLHYEITDESGNSTQKTVDNISLHKNDTTTVTIEY